VVVFALVHLSGDPVLLMVSPDAPPDVVTTMRHALGFDRPLYEQFARYLGNAAHGDLGLSLRMNRPVTTLIVERLPATLELTLAALLIAVVVAVPAGIVSAVKRGTVVDRLAMAGAVAGQAVPIFWLALLLIAFFGVWLRWLPVYGSGSFAHFVLPAVSLSTIIMGRLARLVRSSMLEVLGQDYVRTARAKGLGESRVLVVHALKNASIPIVTLLGLQFAQLLGGAVVTETIFAWPGIGRLVVEAIFNRDFPRGAGRGTGGLAHLRGRQCPRRSLLCRARPAHPHRGGMKSPGLAIWLSAIFLGVTLVGAILAGWVAPYTANEQDIARRLQPPALGPHLLGTDEVGRDVLSRLIYGARISLLVGVVAVALSCPLGVLVGVVAGYGGRRTDDVLMRVTEIQLAIPTILLAIAVVAVLGPGIRNVILTLSVTGWTLYARLTRGETLGVKERDFVQAARATGAGDARIMIHHVLPNVLSPVIVVAIFAVANMIILEATLSFLGLGVEPDIVTWGRMLNGGRLYLSSAWWITAFPGLAIFLTVLAVNLLGDHLRDWLDPRLRNTVRGDQL
jgi:ABC-type dipeptide/oligopeptide/nickel transport system permease subunit